MRKEQLVEVLELYTKKSDNKFQFGESSDKMTFEVDNSDLIIEYPIGKVKTKLDNVNVEEEAGYAYLEVTLPNNDTYTFILGGKR